MVDTVEDRKFLVVPPIATTDTVDNFLPWVLSPSSYTRPPSTLASRTLQWHVCKQIQNYIFKPIQNHVVIIRSGCGTNSRLPVGPIQTLVLVACIHEQQEAGKLWLPWEVQTIQNFHLWRGCPKNWPRPACGSSHCGPNCIITKSPSAFVALQPIHSSKSLQEYV